MGRPNRIVAAFLLVALAVSFATPQPAHAFSGLEIASLVSAGVGRVPLVVKGIIKLFATNDEKKESDKTADETATKPPITVSPDQIFEN